MKLEENIGRITRAMGDDPTLRIRRFTAPAPWKGLSCAVLYIDGMINADFISENIIRPCLEAELWRAGKALPVLLAQYVNAGEVRESVSLDDQIFALNSGDCLLMCEGESAVAVISAKGFLFRAVTEPTNEKSSRGPREGFTEPIMFNLALLRRRLKSPALRLEMFTFENVTKQAACLCYIDGVADARVIDQLKRRLDKLKRRDPIDMAVLAEALKDNPYSPFRTASLTERPDVAASKLLEGRVGLILDGSPMMLCVPFFFIEYFHSPDDYYQNYLVASFARLLRFLCFYLSVSVPALYVALVLYHQEIMPTQLLISIATARSGVPFPLILETLLLLIAFDVLRDASYRMSPALGQSLSIVGALILGEASVSARLISAPLVIVTALTGIAGLINPELRSVSVFFRYGLLLAATLGGIYAVIFGICGITLWLCVTDTFGLPFSDYLFPDKRGAMRDTLVRIPWAKMRPHTLTGGRDYEED